MSMLHLLAGGITRGATSATSFSSATDATTFSGSADAEGFGAAMRGALADVDREWPNSRLPEGPDGQTLATHVAESGAGGDSGDLGGSALVTSVVPGELPTLVPSATGEVHDPATGAHTAETLAAGVAGEGAASGAGLSSGDVDSGTGPGGVHVGGDGGVTGAAVPTAPGPVRDTPGAVRSEGAAAGTGGDEGAVGVAPAASSASAAARVGRSAASTIAGGDGGSGADTLPAQTARVTGASASSAGMRGVAGAAAGAVDAASRQSARLTQPVGSTVGSAHDALAASDAPVAAAPASSVAAASVAADTARVAPEAADFDNVRSVTRLDGAGAAVAPGAATSVSQASPAPAPAPAPTPVPQDFSAQLARPIANIRSAGAGEHVITVNVTPENLGPVTVRAHLGADGMRIELLAPSEAGREALKAILGDLRRDLAGLGVATPSLSTGGQSGNATLNLGDSQGQTQGGQTLGGQTQGGRDGQPAAARNPGAAASNHGDAVASETTHDRGIRGLANGIDVLA